MFSDLYINTEKVVLLDEVLVSTLTYLSFGNFEKGKLAK